MLKKLLNSLTVSMDESFFHRIGNKIKAWKSLNHCFLHVITCADYCASSHQTYILFKNRRDVPVTPVKYVGEHQRADVIGTLNESYLAILEDASVVGSSNVIICGDKMIYDMLLNKKKTYYITDKGLFQCHNTTVHIGKKYIVCYKEKDDDIEEAICLVGNFSSNYYHFVLEILVKWYIVDGVGIPNSVPIVVDSCARDIPQFKELLSIFAPQRRIIYVDNMHMLKVRKLYYPSMVNKLPPNLKKMESLVSEDTVFDMDAIRYLQGLFLDYLGKDRTIIPKKIFISRKNTKRRHYNEEEVIKVAVSKGYEIVYPEMMTIKEQFKLFYCANHILAASGAALTNILCCRPGTKVLVLVSVRLDGTIFSSIAKTLGLRLQYLVGDITNYNNIQSDFIIDCSLLEKTLSEQ